MAGFVVIYLNPLGSRSEQSTLCRASKQLDRDRIQIAYRNLSPLYAMLFHSRASTLVDIE